ncbi:hypothetical protein EGW08_006619 [Elysia chlorotica]|uniref:Uncharacterized protein n=1 Tax=Elysia chlorotica TaxID=188477 RepID=A0A433TVI2_ELYCH|nr:hypothetical protein EGW08_006619 [Elysia chlorotica]
MQYLRVMFKKESQTKIEPTIVQFDPQAIKSVLVTITILFITPSHQKKSWNCRIKYRPILKRRPLNRYQTPPSDWLLFMLLFPLPPGARLEVVVRSVRRCRPLRI